MTTVLVEGALHQYRLMGPEAALQEEMLLHCPKELTSKLAT